MVRETMKDVILALFCIPFLGLAQADSQTAAIPTRETIWNPVLLMTMTLDPSRGEYERLPMTLRNICASTLKGELDTSVFARVRSGETEYIASMGHYNSVIDEYNTGNILEIRENKCEALDLEAKLSMEPANGGYSPTAAQEEQIVRPLIKDAIKRAITAYGGDAPFRSQACKPEEEKELSQAGFVIVRQELKTYCSTTHK